MSNCNCNNNQNICSQCTTTHCECPVNLKSDCITVSNGVFNCSNLENEQTLTEFLEQLDAFICEKFNLTTSFFTLLNVGNGAEIYKGVDGTGRKLIRSLVDSSLIDIEEGVDEITISVNQSALNTFIEANQKLTVVSSAGTTGQSLLNTPIINGDTTTYPLKSLKSSNNSAQITSDTNEVDIKIEIVSPNDSLLVEQNGNVWEISSPTDTTIKQFYVNENYTGGNSNGSILKPFIKLTDALVEAIGTSTSIATPQYENAQIILQTDVTVDQSDLDNNPILQNKISVNTLTIKSDSTEKRVLTFNGTTDYPIDTEFIISEVGFDINSNLLRSVTISLESIHLVNSGSKGIIRHQNYSGGTVNTYDSFFTVKNFKASSRYRPLGGYINAVDSSSTNITNFGNNVFVQSGITNDTPHIYFYGFGSNGEGGATLEDVEFTGTNQTLFRLFQTSCVIEGKFSTSFDTNYMNVVDETTTDGIYLPKPDVVYFDVEESYLIINDFYENGSYPINYTDTVSGRPNFVGGNNSLFKLRGTNISKYKNLLIRKGVVSGMMGEYLLDTDKYSETNVECNFGNFYSNTEALLLTESPQPITTKLVNFNNSVVKNVTVEDSLNNIKLIANFANINSLPLSTTLPAYQSNSLAKLAGLVQGNFYINNNTTFMLSNAGGSPGFLTIVV